MKPGKVSRIKSIGTDHLACTCLEPAVLQAPNIQYEMCRAPAEATVHWMLLASLRLALILPMQIYLNRTTVVTRSSNSSQNTSAASPPANAITKASGGALPSIGSASHSPFYTLLLRDSGQEYSTQ